MEAEDDYVETPILPHQIANFTPIVNVYEACFCLNSLNLHILSFSSFLISEYCCSIVTVLITGNS